jgi:tetratricopeptide (TPR) repeat protein
VPAASALGETKVTDDDEIPSMPELSIEGLHVSGPSEPTPPRASQRPELAEPVELEPEALLEPEPDPEPIVAEAEADDDEEVFDPGSLLEDEPETEPEPEEGGDFDLAAELDEAQAPDAMSQTGSGSAFDEVFAAFKKGISEQIGEDEADAHYDLAIAYREMGLFDDAVRELELVRRGGTRELESLSMIAACKLELGLPAEAIGLIGDALKLPEAIGEVVTSLRYDLGSAFEAAGQANAALAEFKQVVDADPGFRDAADRVSKLEKSG